MALTSVIAYQDTALTDTGQIAVDPVGTLEVPVSKILLGDTTVDGGLVSSANPLPINDASGSITVDAPVGTPVFVRLSDGSAAIATLPVSVASIPSHAVTNAGTFAVQVDGSALTALQLIDDVVYAEDVAAQAADKGIAILAVRRDADTSLVGTDNDYANLQVDANGYLKVEIFDGGGSHTVDNAGTFAVQIDGAALTSLQLIDDAVSGAGFNITQFAGVNVTMGNGASGTGVQRVTIANDSTGILAGVTTVTTVSTVTALTGGGVAHDGVDSGNPHKIGAKAETALSGITLVADGDRTDLHAGVDGVLIVREHCNLEDVVQERTTNTDGAATAFASGLAAPGAGVRLWITSVDLCNSSATFCTVDLRDGAAGAVLWTLPVPATGGVVKTFNPPLKLTANTALAFDASAATTTLTISANGFKSKV